ncbi:MAG TPA: hypothetical protein PKC50_02505 [Elusimicrobiota bacterium]|nr:hypothetical protein [Elusimicrobiota bacterium]
MTGMSTVHKKPLVVFDIGNVLIAFSLERARRNFDRLEPGVGRRLVDKIWNHRNGLGFERGRFTGKAFFQWIRRATGVRMTYRQFRGAFVDIFTPLEKNLKLLERLSATHDTALLSNINPIHWRHVMKEYPGLRRARWRFGSHRLGAMKPAARVYRAVSRKTRTPFERMVYIDDRSDFVAAAKTLGIVARVYDRRRSLAAVLRSADVRP